MKTFTTSRLILLAACYAVCTFSSIYCDDHGNATSLESNHDSFHHGRVINPEGEATNAPGNHGFDELLQLLRTNLDRKPVAPKEVSVVDVTQDAPNEDFAHPSAITGLKKNVVGNGPLGSRILNRRSLVPFKTPESEAPRVVHESNSGLFEQPPNLNKLVSNPQAELEHEGSQRSAIYPREQDVEADRTQFRHGFGLPASRNEQEQHTSNGSHPERQSLVHLLDLFRNKHLESLGLPKQPIKKLVDFVMNKLALRPPNFDVEQHREVRPSRRLFDKVRNLGDLVFQRQ